MNILRMLLISLDISPSHPDIMNNWINHLENIFRKLFFKVEKDEQRYLKIVAQDLDQGRGGSAVVLIKAVTPVTKPGYTNDMVVKFGSREDILEEDWRYHKYAEPFLVARVTELMGPSVSGNLGAVTYSFAGGIGKNIVTFKNYYQSNDAKSICNTVSQIFNETCQRWYEKSKPVGNNPAALYRDLFGLDDKLQRTMDTVSDFCFINRPGFRVVQEITGGRVIIDCPSKGTLVLPNPLNYVKGPLVESINSEHLCIVHGDMNAGNILIDEHGTAWLIDFARTTEDGPLFADFVELETVICNDLLLEKDLESLLEFEATLAEQRDFTECPSIPQSIEKNANFIKAYEVVSFLRNLSGKLFKGTDMRQYFIGLLYNNLNKLALRMTPSRDSKPYETRMIQAFISAALICKSLENW